MKKTFRERVISKFANIAKKNRLLKYPCLGALCVVLSLYHIGMHFASNTKRYAGVLFVVLFFMSSCSFSFAVFAEKTGFISAQETYSAVVEDSDVVLAELPDEGTIYEEAWYADVDAYDDAYDEETYIAGVDEAYSLDDLLEEMDGYDAAAGDGNEGGQDAADSGIDGNGQDTSAGGIDGNGQGTSGNGIDGDGQNVSDGGAADAVFDAADWRLILINKQHPIPENYNFKLGIIKDGMMCDERILEDLLAMMQAAKDDGINLIIRSPYRTDGRQETNFNNRIKLYMSQGYSYMDAYKLTSQVITVPGASEHQVGLALDITSDTYGELNSGFADTEAGRWLAAHGWEYGFTLRYPDGKEYITSIDFEPWHYRYVGREAAAAMQQENICLEEFWDKYL